ncbi:hypothetical protein ENKNEFLB_00074 [Nocardioides aquaticus]|uniref:SRPBCC family protein n=1 Tax=Nocardioides aquaticus TaxID=160826 RepID=A0ABX8EBM3_9ACTN|nr:hypothetical protein [Nocardioides aquaticus]QVT77709.1 hypothetical protein ENKNEFLB_00074 [Nocardioides aquaticus]
MSGFTATTTAEAIVLATREQIWEVLRDADEVARLTPFVTRIEDRGEHWIWSMTKLPVPKATLSPTFTEKMEFVELERIEFKHDAPEGSDENACVDGWYELEELEPLEGEPAATMLRTSLSITLDLPLPKALGPAVKASMKTVINQMGDRFSAGMLETLGTTTRGKPTRS